MTTSETSRSDSSVRTVIIAGGAGALGGALARTYVEDGARVKLLDSAGSVEDVATDLGAQGFACDVSSATDLARLPMWDRVDVLINAVGSWPRHRVDDLDRGLWDELLTINLTSAFTMTRHVIGSLRTARGAVVNLSSAVALKGHEEMIPYVTAKAGLLGLTRSLARALGPDGVRVNAVAPGLIRTATNDSRWEDQVYASVREQRALARDQMPQDVVGAVRFLAGPSSDFVTGQTLVVDGGVLMV